MRPTGTLDTAIAATFRRLCCEAVTSYTLARLTADLADADHTARALGRVLTEYERELAGCRARLRIADGQLDSIFQRWGIRRPLSSGREDGK